VAGTWFNRGVTLDPDYGDAWAHFYKFEQMNGSKDNTDAILQRVKKAQPRHGQSACVYACVCMCVRVRLHVYTRVYMLLAFQATASLTTVLCRGAVARRVQADGQLECRGAQAPRDFAVAAPLTLATAR